MPNRRDVCHRHCTDRRLLYQAAAKDPDALTIPLGFVSGHSRSFIGSAGSLNLNLRTGAYGLSLTGLVSGTSYNVWLLDEGQLDDASDDRPFLLTTATAINGANGRDNLTHLILCNGCALRKSLRRYRRSDSW